MLDDNNLVTIETWTEYCSNLNLPSDCLEYINANKHFAKKLLEMLENAQTFDDLKAMVKQLHEERTQFVDFAADNLPS